MGSLVALLVPAAAMPLALWLARGVDGLPRIDALSTWPIELWVVALAGLVATTAGVLDWRFHRRGGRRIAAAERRAERAALLLGVPLFALLAAASVAERPMAFVAPIVAVALPMAGLVAHDETRFHRACGRFERSLHRLLVGGNAIAFLAWLHWCCGRTTA